MPVGDAAQPVPAPRPHQHALRAQRLLPCQRIGARAADLDLHDVGVRIVGGQPGDGAHAPRQPLTLVPPEPAAGGVAISVTGSIGDYRAGDAIWCELRAPDAFGQALNRDVLVPLPAGRFLFARLIGQDGDALLLLPLTPNARPTSITSPAWLAQASRLIRAL